jgi:hypothetical protein
MNPKIESVFCEVHARFPDGDGVGGEASSTFTVWRPSDNVFAE